jgi:hypothetical protein
VTIGILYNQQFESPLSSPARYKEGSQPAARMSIKMTAVKFYLSKAWDFRDWGKPSCTRIKKACRLLAKTNGTQKKTGGADHNEDGIMST